MYGQEIQRRRSEKGRIALQPLRTDLAWIENYSKKLSIAQKKRTDEGHVKFTTGNVWLDRSRKDETRQKMSDTHQLRGNHQGEKNSQFGTVWIYNLDLKISKKIPKSEIDLHVSEGWILGRKIKF